jgi:hypothetical protein
MDISSSLADGEPSLNQLANGLANGLPNGHAAGTAASRFRGVSVDRHREYQAPLYYEDTYYKRDPYDSSGDDRARYDSLPSRPKNGGPYHRSVEAYDGLDDDALDEDDALDDGIRGERTIFKLERQWSHPNLRPRPRNAGRRLPQTPRHPPGLVVPLSPVQPPASQPDDLLLEWVENERIRRTPKLANHQQRSSFESDYSDRRDGYSPPSGGGGRTDVTPTAAVVRRTPVSDRRIGTGRMLPKPPPGGSHLVLNAAQAKQSRGLSRERKLPKPSSLDLRNANRELPCRSTSINFPRIDSSPSRMSNFIDGTSIIPSLPPSKKGTGGYPRQLPVRD